MKIKNKKSFIGDVLSGAVFVFGGFILFTILIIVFFHFNSAVQDSQNFPVVAKDLSDTHNSNINKWFGWLLIGIIVSTFIYSLVTAYLIEVISILFFVVGLVSSVVVAIASYFLKFIFFELITNNQISKVASGFPIIFFYFENLVLILTLWGFLLLLVTYTRVNLNS